MLSNTSYEETKNKIEGLSREVCNPSEGELPIYFSYGIATIEKESMLDSEDLLLLVDKHMYEDKKKKKLYCYRGVYDNIMI